MKLKQIALFVFLMKSKSKFLKQLSVIENSLICLINNSFIDTPRWLPAIV